MKNKLLTAAALTIGIALASLSLPAFAKETANRGGMMQGNGQYSCEGWNTGFETIDETNLNEAITTALEAMNMDKYKMGAFEEQSDGTFIVDIVDPDGELAFQVRTSENGVIHPIKASMQNMMKSGRGCH